LAKLNNKPFALRPLLAKNKKNNLFQSLSIFLHKKMARLQTKFAFFSYIKTLKIFFV